MPSFNFDTLRDRTTGDSLKWEKYRGRDIVPLWVADMDFAAPPAVIAALQARVAEGIYGYAKPSADLVAITVAYLERRYGWVVDPAWLVWTPGVVPALHVCCRMLQPDDAVLTTTPIYPPFLSVPRAAKRERQTVPMTFDGGRWSFDWAGLEAAVTPATRLFMLCSPYNPLGRAFDSQELAAVAAFCQRHNLILCSDEIHCDLILDDRPHLPTATLGPEAAARTITLMAPSKTFNVPGLATALAVIPDATLRQRFTSAMSGAAGELSPLGYAACAAAWRDGEPWRQALLAYLRANRDRVEQFVAAELPRVRMSHVDATYLAWLDVSALGLPDPAAACEAAGVGLSDGKAFGQPGCLRLNFGCPRSTLEMGLARLPSVLGGR